MTGKARHPNDQDTPAGHRHPPRGGYGPDEQWWVPSPAPGLDLTGLRDLAAKPIPAADLEQP